MFFSDPVKKLKPWAERNARIAYAPITEPGHGADRGSRFNGSPFLADGEAWPACQHCKKPMPLFLQLDLDDLPGAYAGQFGSGLLQLFYCVGECESNDSEAWATFDHTSKLARVVPRDAAGAIAAPRDTGLKAQPQAIKSWASHTECCNWDEAEAHGIKNETKREGDRYKTRFTCTELGIDTGWLGDEAQDKVNAEIFNPRNRDKLGGWPFWVQGVEYPNCPQCQTQMRLVFQIDSDDHVPRMFGDVGCGHITQCPNHHDVVTFGWACS